MSHSKITEDVIMRQLSLGYSISSDLKSIYAKFTYLFCWKVSHSFLRLGIWIFFLQWYITYLIVFNMLY